MGRHVRDTDPTRRRRLALVSVVGSFAVVVSTTVLSAQAQDAAPADPWGAAELVVNGGFEDGTRGWRTNDAERQQLGLDDDAFAAEAAARLTRGTGTGTVVLNDARNTVVGTERGQRFRAAVAVRAGGPRMSGQLRIREVTASGVRTSGTSFHLTDDEWHVVRLDIEVRGGASLDLNVLAWKVARGSGLDVDSVSLVEVDDQGRPVPVEPPPGATPGTPAPTAPTTTDASGPGPVPTQVVPTTTTAPPPSATPTPTTTPRATPRPRPTVGPPPAPTSPPPTTPPPTSPPPTSGPQPDGRLTNGCAYSTRGIPECGVLFGAAVGSNTDPSAHERGWGAQLGVRRTYWGPTQIDSAVATARTDLAAGRLPWISFKLPYSWADMAAGRGDAWARELVAELDALDGPVWLAFHHEPENDGDITQWVAMQRHLSPIVRGMADNVAFSLVVTGWHQLYGDPAYSLESIWPGDGLVDLIGFDIYNAYGLVRDGVTTTRATDLAESYYPQISAFARKHDVAWGIAETGYTDEAAAVDLAWLARSYEQTKAFGGVAMAYFDTTLNSQGSWRLEGAKSAAFGAVLRKAPALS
ncbi:glycoside hydrolase family 26 protein [Cellulomonas gilvus]|uniref:GH26 domain-containing protein n=1 Tax=Cellulomonas gilvus (strain ATCC 13127 / NRRL B-14078) TaxID=593907 RepID=F8A6R1_CELGA|nr:hypothetical protein [Cellulomonas gilvus]AEI11121.1 hypothetical protein Celgi_0601 [Cellulomonas gilvus ATCC 13127]